MKRFMVLVLILLVSCDTQKDSRGNGIDSLWQSRPGDTPEIFGPGIISLQGRFEMGMSISPDGNSLAFGVLEEANPKETCLYLMRNSHGTWTAPDKASLVDHTNTYFPMFSPDGKKLYFAKSENGLELDLWQATYLEGKLLDARPLDSFNSKAREAGHGQSSIGSFYFTSNRDEEHPCCGDIYFSEFQSDGYTPVQKSEVLSTASDEESLFLSPKEDFIIIQAWKNEFESMHDLYISFRTKDQSWTSPTRLNDTINSKGMEQRPFVSHDNKWLFFSRITYSQKNQEDHVESDLYWVSTQQVFVPYVYRSDFQTDVQFDKPFEVKLPADLFRDIDDDVLSYQVVLKDGSRLPEWMTFESSSLVLIGVWKATQPLDLKVVASDDSGNTGEFEFKLGKKEAR